MSNDFGSLQGKVVLACPTMEDPNFHRTVVYMVRHTPDDAFGLVINRPTEFDISKVMESITEREFHRAEPMYRGGPVDGPLILLHNFKPLGDFECQSGVYLTSDRERVLDILASKETTLKLFDGFSGWGPGQLENEIATGSWIVSPISADEVFSDQDNLWQSLVHRIGHDVFLASGFPLGDRDKARWN
jgi:putative transcriptional regulator